MENFEGFPQILKELSGEKKVLGCVYKPNSNHFKIRKRPYLKKNLCGLVAVDYEDTQFSSSEIENLWENRKNLPNHFRPLIWGPGQIC